MNDLLAPSALPTFSDIERAAERLRGVAHKTPVVTSRTVDALSGARVFFKCENLQRAGSFKIRGAYNAMVQLSPEQRQRGVVAFSSGNHAQAVALAGQLLDIPRVIVMPKDAPGVKIAATRGYGADVVLYDRFHDDREAIGQTLAGERGLATIPPYNHPHVIAGAGTAVRELLEETGPLDAVLVPCGGGGLLSGSSLAAKGLAPGCRVFGVEPAAGDDAARSFATKTLQTVKNPDTIADGARTPSLGSYTFPLVLAHAAGVVTVDDGALARWMFFVWERLKLVVEPTGALGIAALLEKTIDLTGLRVGVVLTGGNVDLADVPHWRSLT